MDLVCYLFPGWEPRIQAASPKRGWMDAAPESFPYRCLPLNIANSHGWEILSPCGFEVEWNGGILVDDVVIRPDPGSRERDVPVALFGQGTLTFHVEALFRTSPGWNLFVSGPPNLAKDGVAPLSGIIETDWSPYTFTMNWRLTRPNHVVRFEENEPFAHIFPIERQAIEGVRPAFAPLDEDPDLKTQFQTWSRSRDAFHERMRTDPPDNPSERWQKLYYRGQRPDGQCPVADHQSKLRVREFANRGLAGAAEEKMRKPFVPPTAASTVSGPAAADAQTEAGVAARWQADKLAWIMRTQEQQRGLSPAASALSRTRGMTSQEFLDNHYAPSRPVVFEQLVKSWRACTHWSAEYLAEKIGDRTIEYQGDRTTDPRFELNKDAHKRQASFAEFIELITLGNDNDFYITAYNSDTNREALAPLAEDLGSLDGLLAYRDKQSDAMFWIGPANTFTPLHHDLTNNLLVQFVGRKQIVLVSPADTPRLYNDLHVFSAIGDLADPGLDTSLHPLLNGLRFEILILNPGDALFIPIGWWHQVRSFDFSVSATYTNFLWPNEGWQDHPVKGAA